TAIENKPWFLLWNKSDLVKPTNRQILSTQADSAQAILYISAKTGAGISELGKAMENWLYKDNKIQDNGASLNTRQAVLCEKAMAALQLVKNTLVEEMPHDCLATDLKSALDHLSEIEGSVVSEELIGTVFANFCIGK